MASSKGLPPPSPPDRARDRATEEAGQEAVRRAVAATAADVLPHVGDHPDGTVLVRPRDGRILPDVPRSGARMPIPQAQEWARNGLVAIVEGAP